MKRQSRHEIKMQLDLSRIMYEISGGKHRHFVKHYTQIENITFLSKGVSKFKKQTSLTNAAR